MLSENLIGKFNSIFGIKDIICLIILLVLLIMLYQSLFFIFRDKKNSETYNKLKNEEPEDLTYDDLKSTPLLNIVVPAWKEGDLFRKCLDSIKLLKYPRIKVIVNAGGWSKTIEIANSFKKLDRFIVLRQKSGSHRPSHGKIRAINKCLEYIEEGLVYFIDADSYLNDEIILRMIHPIINMNQYAVAGGVRPLKEQMRINLVKYLIFDRFNLTLKRKTTPPPITGANFCIKMNILNSINNRFKESRKIATDLSMGLDLAKKDFSIFQLYNYSHRIYVDYPTTLPKYIDQKKIWIENGLVFSIKNKRKSQILRYIVLNLVSLYVVTNPIFIVFNIKIFILGLLIFLSLYLVKIRKLFFFKMCVDAQNRATYGFLFFVKLIFYVYFEAFSILLITFHFLSNKKNLL